MMNHENSIQRLAQTFTVKDIMIPKYALISATNEETALKKLEEYPDFDVIPIVRYKKIVAYLQRGTNEIKPISWQDIISDSTNIFDLVDILQNHNFCFVLVKDQIDGYVHFSDLNKVIVKLPYFLMIAKFEKYLLERLEPVINEDKLKEVLDPERIIQIKDRMLRMKKGKSELNWASLLSIKELLLFSKKFEMIKLEHEQIDDLSQIRNAVCHSGRELIEKHEDVKRLAESRSIMSSALI